MRQRPGDQASDHRQRYPSTARRGTRAHRFSTAMARPAGDRRLLVRAARVPKVGSMDEGTRPATDPVIADDLESGQQVGEYRIESKLAEGGMGSIYTAVHPLIDKRAAIKVISPQLSLDRL